MSLRFFCDHCVPTEIADVLRQQQHDVLILRDALPVDASDVEVITKAKDLDRILVSLNGDFSDIVAYPPAIYSGVVAIQLHNHPEVILELMQRLHVFFKAHDDQQYYHQKLFIVEAHRIRIRHSQD